MRPRPATAKDLSVIATIAAEEFADHRPLSEVDLVDWTQKRAPTLVVHNTGGEVIGYARAKPNEALGVSRIAGQTAILAQIAVIPTERQNGVGVALHDRILKTLGMLGYSRVFAQVPTHLEEWYRQMGWTIHREGEVLAWVEPPNSQDDALAEGATPRTFAPILCIEYLSDYPILVERWIGDARPLLEWSLDGRVLPDELTARIEATLSAAILHSPQLAARLPQALCDAVICANPHSDLSDTLLAAGR